MTEPSRAHQGRQRRRLTATEVDLGRRAPARAPDRNHLRDRHGRRGGGVARRARAARRHRRRRSGPFRAPTPAHARSRDLHRQGQGRGAAGRRPERSTSTSSSSTTSSRPRSSATWRSCSRSTWSIASRSILDIFAQHATSQEGAVQVELAQLRYRLPRLRGRGLQLSQQGAGIGTRGPGETQLEVDRRRLLRRMQKLERDLVGLAATRATQRKARKRRDIPHVALVGYTNAGKSTLLNRLTHAGVLGAEPAVLHARPHRPATPPPRRRDGRCSPTPSGSCAVCRTNSSRPSVRRSKRSSTPICSCTWSTRARPTSDALIDAVEHGAARDRGRRRAPPHRVEQVRPRRPRRAEDPARRLPRVGGGLGRDRRRPAGPPRRRSSDRLRALARVSEFVVPYERGDVLAALHRAGEVLVEVHGDDATRVRARLPEAAAGRFSEYASTPD